MTKIRRVDFLSQSVLKNTLTSGKDRRCMMYRKKTTELALLTEKIRGQSLMMPRHHPEMMRLNKVISWQTKICLPPFILR